MKFALLGSDREALALARVVSDSPEHELSGIYALSEKAGAAEILESLESPRRGESWESALLGNVAQAVIVARPIADEQLDDPLRRMAQEAMPALVVHPACTSLMALELEMIRADTGALLVPYLPAAGHPAVDQLAAWSRDPAGPLGAVSQVVIERPLAGASPREVLQVFARDAHLARRLVGEIDRVSAHGGDQTSLANLTVQMTSHSGVLVRWSASPEAPPTPGEHGATGRVLVLGAAAKAELVTAESPADWALQRADALEPLPAAAEWDPAAAAIAELAAAARGGPPTRWDWRDACRSLEITEAVERSLARSRTIELYHELPTEEATFKGMMAAGGCLLLMLALLVLVLVGIFGDGLRLRGEGAGFRFIWPWLIGVPLFLFTLLQVLKFVFPQPKKPDALDEGPPPNPPEDAPDQADSAG